MDLIGTVKDGRVVLSPQMAMIRDDYVGRMKDGTAVRLTIARLGRNKSREQLGAHFGLLIGMILQEFEDRGWDLQVLCPGVPPGLSVPKNVMHEYLLAVAGHVGDNGEQKRCREMSTLEMSRFFEYCRNYAASAWGICVPDPDPLYRLKEVDDGTL